MVFVAETWFGELSAKGLTGYDLRHRDRLDGRGGGVPIYVRSVLDSVELMDGSLRGESVEHIWCRVTVNGERVLIGCMYRPPNGSNKRRDAAILPAIVEAKRQVDAKSYDSMLFVGDFNMKEIGEKFGFVCGSVFEHSRRLFHKAVCS